MAATCQSGYVDLLIIWPFHHVLTLVIMVVFQLKLNYNDQCCRTVLDIVWGTHVAIEMDVGIDGHLIIQVVIISVYRLPEQESHRSEHVW